MVYGSSALPGAELLTLVSVMDTLRLECPWDARQTHESLAPYLPEESYEALDALESGDPAALREELGDVLLQVMFHSEVASERTDGTGYTADDVADGIVAKLVRRHPHVFGGVRVSGAEEVTQNWDAIRPPNVLSRPLGDRARLRPGRSPPGPARPRPGRPAAAPGRAHGPPELAGPGGPGGPHPTWVSSCSRWWAGPAPPA